VWIEIVLLSRLAKEPTLRRFVDAGAVIRTAEDQEAKPSRLVYTITDVGQELLHDMLADLPEELALIDAEFLARLGNFSWLRDHERHAVLDTRERVIAAEHDRLAALAAAQADSWSRAVLDEIGRRFTEERAWLDALRSAVRSSANSKEGS
jgi:hypothetical protein